MTITNPAKIKVFGVGGGGCNMVNSMYELPDIDTESIEIYAVNTDVQHLNILSVPNKIQIGEKVTKGLGAGADPSMGERAALEDKDKLQELMKDADMVFISAGLGGGTGTGAAPVIAGLAKEMGILTVAVVTTPFSFEGKDKMKRAEKGLEELKKNVDTYIVIHNQRLSDLDIPETRDMTFAKAFKMVDTVLAKTVYGITNIIVAPALINVDFADVRTIMHNGGLALIGIGEGEGPNKVEEAVESAINSPLLEGSNISGARRMLITVWVSEDTQFQDVENAINRIRLNADENVNLIFGAILDGERSDYMRIAVIATDFGEPQQNKQPEFKVIDKRSTDPYRIPAINQDYDINDIENVPAVIRRPPRT